MLKDLVEALNSHSETTFIALYKKYDYFAYINDSIDQHNNTFLHIAASKSLENVVIFLLENNAEVDKQNLSLQTPLRLAITYQHAAIVKILLLRNAKADIYDSYGYTPLHLAAVNPSTSILKLILESLSAQNKLSEVVDLPMQKTLATPLLLAINKECESNVVLLLECGADPNSKNKHNLSCVKLATEGNNPNILSSLLFWGGDLPSLETTNNFYNLVDKYRKIREEKSLIKTLLFINNNQLPSLKMLAGLVVAQSHLKKAAARNKLTAELNDLIQKGYPKRLLANPFPAKESSSSFFNSKNQNQDAKEASDFKAILPNL